MSYRVALIVCTNSSSEKELHPFGLRLRKQMQTQLVLARGVVNNKGSV